MPGMPMKGRESIFVELDMKRLMNILLYVWFLAALAMLGGCGGDSSDNNPGTTVKIRGSVVNDTYVEGSFIVEVIPDGSLPGSGSELATVTLPGGATQSYSFTLDKNIGRIYVHAWNDVPPQGRGTEDPGICSAPFEVTGDVLGLNLGKMNIPHPFCP